MKLRISSKLASVYSEVNVVDSDGALRFSTMTDPLSSPQVTRLLDESGQEVARYSTARADARERKHRIVMADGTSFTATRRFRVSASTSESTIRVAGSDWVVLTQRAWSSRFEIRTEGDRVLARAKQLQALRGDAYDVDIKDEEHLVEMLLLSLIARSVIRGDAPSPVWAPSR